MSSVVKNNRVRISGQKKIIFNAPNSQYSQKNEVINNEQKVDINYAELLQKSKQQAKNIIAEAKEAAEQIILEAQVEATKLAEAAKDEGNREGYSIGYDEGYKQGFAEGLEQGKTQYDTLIEEANQIKQKHLEDKEKLYEVSEKNMLMLAIDIAKQIIGDALGKDDKVYMELAYNALKLVQCQRKIQLKVSSDDLPYVLKNKNQLLSSLRGIDDIQIIEDSHLDRGSCIIDTGNGIIDASLKSQIEKIESALVELANSAQ